jgi:hypothetical protein
MENLSYPCIGPEWFQVAETPRFQYSRHMHAVRLSALHTGRKIAAHWCVYLPRHLDLIPCTRIIQTFIQLSAAYDY